MRPVPRLAGVTAAIAVLGGGSVAAGQQPTEPAPPPAAGPVAGDAPPAVVGAPPAPPAPAAEPTATATPAASPEPPAVVGTPVGPAAVTTPEPGTQEDASAAADRQRAAQRRAADADRADRVAQEARQRARRARDRERAADGTPTTENPETSLALPGAAPVGVPNFFIEKFRIPPFLLPIYQAAGIEYGVRWEILAAINEIETDYGRNLNVSTAGAMGWMQFIPSSWEAFGVDANRDGEKDPYNPVDAIFAAARYLKEHDADTDIRKAIFAYNHADWYVDSVLMRARLIGGLPADLVSSLTGLTQGSFPVRARARYADDLSAQEPPRKVARGRNAARVVEADPQRRGIEIFAKAGSPVIAVQDGRILRIGRSDRLGRFVQLQDAYGTVYTYGRLGAVADRHPVPREGREERPGTEDRSTPAPRGPRTAALRAAHADAARRIVPTLSASALLARERPPGDGRRAPAVSGAVVPAGAPAPDPGHVSAARAASGGRALLRDRYAAYERTAPLDDLPELPSRPLADLAAGVAVPGVAPPTAAEEAGATTPLAHGLAAEEYDPVASPLGLDTDRVRWVPLRVGSQVVAGTRLAEIAEGTERRASHVRFEIRPAGRDAPRIDPKPILDGWKLLESTALYRAKGDSGLRGAQTIGEILLLGKTELQRRVLADPRIRIHACGRDDIRIGRIDRRVLASLAFLSESGLRPGVSSLRCGRETRLTASGNVSEHSVGGAVDIATVNGIPVLGHQEDGSVTDQAIRRLLTLQGTMRPHQIISLRTYPGADNTIALPDHADHIHVGWSQEPVDDDAPGTELAAVLAPGQWTRLLDRLGEIENPVLSPADPSAPAEDRP